ncbi:hypothetical protein [Thermomonospora umbrina]|uniref:Nitroreductase family protein n=1 Tax=Thermomonospora umbrina TaxID=111806 RepID=A0A3D9SWW6_9ACTN|nr:hypothetical protein [Thermomonospora umbrina]REF00078.1 hypothetical protein DFJ69_5601 [Thermomonospora umbrina]
MRRSTEHLVVGATMIPAIHDVPAWRFQVVPQGIEVVADPARFRPSHDPCGRDLRIKCGAALMNLRLAAAQLGRDVVVRPAPDQERPALLATVRLARRRRVSRSERLLYAASLRPAPWRRPAGERPPSLREANELAGAARLEGAALVGLPMKGVNAALLVTSGDGPADWLRAGQALQRILLSCAVLGVPASVEHEAAEIRGPGGVLDHGDVPQALLSFGVSVDPVRQIDRERDRDGDPHRVG